MSFSNIAQTAIDSVSLGSLYALIALGIALIFGIMQLVNFAHGELILVSAYALVVIGSVSWPVMVLAALATGAVVAMGMERAAFRPVRGAPPATLLVTSFAVSYFLQNLAIVVFGAHARSVSTPSWITMSFEVGSLRIPVLNLVTIAVTAIAIAVLVTFLRRSTLGLHMRAAADDFEMARLLGVDANKVIAAAFAISGILAGFAAILFVAQVGVVTPMIGVTPFAIGVVAIVLGGMGSLPGAAVGGFLLGVLTTVIQTSLPVDAQGFRDAILFAGVIVILVVRPRGIFPTRSTVRV